MMPDHQVTIQAKPPRATRSASQPAITTPSRNSENFMGSGSVMIETEARWLAAQPRRCFAAAALGHGPVEARSREC